MGIKEADRLIEEALAGKGSIAAENQAVDELEQETQISSGNVGHSIYKNLMNGVSHMLPFVVAGGVLIALSLLFGAFIHLIQKVVSIMLPLLC